MYKLHYSNRVKDLSISQLNLCKDSSAETLNRHQRTSTNEKRTKHL